MAGSIPLLPHSGCLTKPRRNYSGQIPLRLAGIRAGMNDKELDKQFSSTTIEEMKSILEKQMLMNRLVNERQEEMQKELEQRRKLDPLLNQLLENPQVLAKISASQKASHL